MKASLSSMQFHHNSEFVSVMHEKRKTTHSKLSTLSKEVDLGKYVFLCFCLSGIQTQERATRVKKQQVMSVSSLFHRYLG
jgi:predicted SprT family Zn-dependent metalloprotease